MLDQLTSTFYLLTLCRSILAFTATFTLISMYLSSALANVCHDDDFDYAVIVVLLLLWLPDISYTNLFVPRRFVPYARLTLTLTLALTPT